MRACFVLLLGLVLPAFGDAAGLYLVVTANPTQGTRAASALLPKEDRAQAWQPTGAMDLGGVWVLGGVGGRPCPRATLAATYVDEALRRAQTRIDALETAEAGSDLASVRQTVACLSAPVQPRSLWRMHFLEAVAAFYTAGLPSARPALNRALAVLPAEPFDPAYPPELRDLYLEVQRAVLAARPSTLAAASAGPDQPGAVFVDGEPANGPALSIVPGEHILQLRDSSGTLRGMTIDVPSLAVMLVAPPAGVGEALGRLDTQARTLLSDAIARAAGARTATVWIHSGAQIWDPITGAPARRVVHESTHEGSVAAASDPILQLSAGAGYQFLAGLHWFHAAIDGDLRLKGPLRLEFGTRPSFLRLPGEAELEHPGKRYAVLVPFGVGIGFRWVRPFVVHLPILAQFAVNTSDPSAPPFLVGALAGLSVEIPLGTPRLFLRPRGELGFLGRYFVARAGLQFGVVVGAGD